MEHATSGGNQPGGPKSSLITSFLKKKTPNPGGANASAIAAGGTSKAKWKDEATANTSFAPSEELRIGLFCLYLTQQKCSYQVLRLWYEKATSTGQAE
jgi:hypothetical protein